MVMLGSFGHEPTIPGGDFSCTCRMNLLREAPFAPEAGCNSVAIDRCYSVSQSRTGRYYDNPKSSGDTQAKVDSDNECKIYHILNDHGYFRKIVQAYSSDGGIRMNLIYQRHPNYYKQPASVFFALDLMKTSDYATSGARLSLTEPSTPIGTAARSSISFPDYDCPQLKDFLEIMFPSYIPDWMP